MHNTVRKGKISQYSYYVYIVCVFIKALVHFLKTITLRYCCCSNTRVTLFSGTTDTDVPLIRRKSNAGERQGDKETEISCLSFHSVTWGSNEQPFQCLLDTALTAIRIH